MYLKEFEIRWNDLDANRHLANSSYVNYMSHTRMCFLTEYGFGRDTLIRHNIGPVVFREHIHYFKEAIQGKITVGFELGGYSEDGMFLRFLHNFYDEHGKNLAFCEMRGGWIDLSERKLVALPQELREKLSEGPKSEDFKILTREDMRIPGLGPRDLKLQEQ